MSSVCLGCGASGSVKLVNQLEHRPFGDKLKNRAVKTGRISQMEVEILSSGIRAIPKYVCHKKNRADDSISSVTMQVAKRASVEKHELIKVAESVARAVVDINEKFKNEGKLREGETLIHHDIKPENIGKTKGGKFKLLDWGSATIVSKDTAIEGTRGATIPYLAPEGCSGSCNAEKLDSWALGATLFKYATNKSLLNRENIFSLLMSTALLQDESALKKQIDLDPITSKMRKSAITEFRENCFELMETPEIDSFIQMLIVRLLEINPEKRLSLQEVVTMIEAYKAKQAVKIPKTPTSVFSDSTSISPASLLERGSKLDDIREDEVEEDLEHPISLDLSLDQALEVDTDDECEVGSYSDSE